MSNFSVQRRNALKLLGLALGSPLVGPFLLKALASESFRKNDISHFSKVSSLLLGVPVSEIDKNVAKVYWAKLATLPKAQTLLEALYKVAMENNTPISSVTQLPEETRPFAKKIVQLWYTGVLEVSSKNRRRFFYQDSLMFKFFSKDRPAPGTCSGSGESWTKPPNA